ncbi:MAG TPA: VCBS repeat-containing protein [Planctomycetota bacterium]|jgi:hypothetical protein|nr:VCBS repeat-containing protein [Planctomycetota bacterium]
MFGPRSLVAVAAWAAVLAAPILAQVERFDDLHRMLPWDATASTNAVALGDVDGDGDLDLLLGNEDLDRLYLNGGLGLFRIAPSNLPAVVDDTYALALGDVDGDGDFDLLLGNNGQSRLYLNDGSGVLADATGQLPTLSDATRALALGDVDGDGDLDEFIGNIGQDRLYLNGGAGAFSNATSLLPLDADSSYAVALGDLDGDGDLDALSATGSCSLYLNGGAGSFSNGAGQLPPPPQGFLRAMAVGDVDLDGDLDAVLGGLASCAPYGCTAGPIVLYRNEGSATFTVVSQATAAFSNAFALGDVDGDGDLDLFAGMSGNCGKYGCGFGQDLLLANDGLGTLTAVAALQAPLSWTNAVALGDIDGDGDLDAVTGAGYLAGLTNRVFLNNGVGALKDATGQVAPTPSAASAIALGDLDGDGDLDAFFAGAGYAQNGGPTRVLLNDGAGSLQNASAQPTGSGFASDLALGDVDGDGDLDALVVSPISSILQVSHRLYLNNGTGAFVVATGLFPQDFVSATAVSLPDVDGDGDLDAVVGTRMGPGLPPTPLRLYPNNGLGAFSLAPGGFPQGLQNTTDFAVGDVDGDGDPDILAGAGACPVTSPCPPAPSRLYLNTGGTGVFYDASTQLPSNPDVTVAVALGDVEGDGDLDVYLANGLSFSSAPRQDRLYLNDGSGFFFEATGQIPAEDGPGGPVSLLDADGDGDLDAWIGVSPQPRLYLNDGTGVLSDAPSSLPVGWSDASDLAVGDLDGDGDPDLVLADSWRVRVLSNLTRQLSWRALPRIGKPLTFDLRGPAWGAWFLVASLGTGSTPLPPLGVLRLDLATLIPILGGLLDAQGHAAVTYQVPGVPALVGQTLYWQAVVVGPARLTNLEKTTFTNL